ncbi:sensor histidine kinase [Zunongwangia atlantica]|uniref:histidine kinase n=1 Tax=Zunongwangia atlantica 22II14-10F7 TaxID=1185767 RepID=A0A1Y1SZ99_9FLAO|nr:ATP-binding protein [Zunongwangia atlantica]ORL43563.1 integral membrane sensor signal transduction histidine kinase [Zunongwangia atlantica 22II14-10F7]
MKLSFKDRIAFYYMLATALIVAFAFLVVFILVKQTVYQQLDNDLHYEATMHLQETTLEKGKPVFWDKAEWEEREHNEVQVNPVFVQVMDSTGEIITDKSPNLKEYRLPFYKEKEDNEHYNAYLEDELIRQIQVPVKMDGKVYGYIITAMSFEGSQDVITRLAWILILCYPFILIGLFFISRLLAGRSIKPIQEITQTTNLISRDHLNERVSLPENQDELYELSLSINSLLDRVEQAIERERQFTSDASHELRTPISSIRGTLEVLIRKERTREDYENKINYSLDEIDRMSLIIEQLLFLARNDETPKLDNNSKTEIISLIDEVLNENSLKLKQKNIQLVLDAEDVNEFLVHYYYGYAILNNVVENAIKYAYPNSKLIIELKLKNSRAVVKVIDEGIGIKEADIGKIFNPFFRSEGLDHKDIKGTGLGLSIVQKAAQAIGAQIEVSSIKHKGTTFTIYF